ncbi:AAA family ATPase [Sorangium sp. So ce233]|uniref:AAA family ATPase n=1 Tax=Sorangium sp. So ce233 TaxID=3133290 RepID=UPI003F601E4D
MTAYVRLPESPSIILITGLMAAGKSTVAQALAERLPRSVHLRGDVFRRMIVSGRAEMDFELSDEAERQLRLRYRIAAAAADLYLQAGFTVVHQDIILGPSLAEVVQHYLPRPLHVVVLCPDPAVVAAREAGRAKRGYQDTSAVLDFDRVLRTETPRLGLWLDTSGLTVAETVDRILARPSEARVNGAEIS